MPGGPAGGPKPADPPADLAPPAPAEVSTAADVAGNSEGTGTELEEGDPTPIGKLRGGPPEELTARPQWVAWRPEVTPDGRPVKPPYRPGDPARRADVGDPATSGTYAAALEACDGGRVGFVLTAGDPYAVADLDGCRDPETGELEAWARGVVEALDSYTEISPSGRGLHVWVRGELPGLRRRGGGTELYDRARYVTVTGEALPGYDRAEIAELYRRLFGDPEASITPPDRSARNGPPAGIAGDDRLLGRAMRVGWFPAVWGAPPRRPAAPPLCIPLRDPPLGLPGALRAAGSRRRGRLP